MVLQLHFDLMSQPARAMYLFLKMANVDFEPHKVSLMTGEHLKPEYGKINPLHKVPVLIDGDFTLTESVAQLRYISAAKNVAESWYPRKDLRKQARVDEFLNWHHTGLRKQCIEFGLTNFRTKVALGRFTKIPFDAEKIKELKEALANSVKQIDEVFLKGKRFIIGDEISAADLIGYCELVQMWAIGEESIYTSNANVSEWMKRIEAKMGHLKDEVFAVLQMLKDKYNSDS